MNSRARLVLVVAAAEGGVIGLDGTLPWHIPEDLRHFRKLTIGKHILMGRKTFESIGKPLPERRSIVLTRNRGWSYPGVDVVHGLDDALALVPPDNDLMVIGGEQLYRLTLPFAGKIELTEVQHHFDGDTYFPIISNRGWLRTREEQVFSPKEGLYVNFVTMVSRESLEDSYLSFKLDDLLQKYGEGRHIPGSGSAAALQGLLAGRLVATVVKLSISKQSCQHAMRQLRYIDHQIATVHLPELSRLFDEDIAEFDKVYQLRKKRDAATDLRKRKNIVSQERRRLQNATEIPAAIAHHCLSVAEHALYVYRHGFHAVRGDSGAAISSACAGALSAAFVIGTNLSRFSKGEWHKKWSDIALRLEVAAISQIGEAVKEVEDIRRVREIEREPELDLLRGERP